MKNSRPVQAPRFDLQTHDRPTDARSTNRGSTGSTAAVTSMPTSETRVIVTSHAGDAWPPPLLHCSSQSSVTRRSTLSIRWKKTGRINVAFAAVVPPVLLGSQARSKKYKRPTCQHVDPKIKRRPLRFQDAWPLSLGSVRCHAAKRKRSNPVPHARSENNGCRLSSAYTRSGEINGLRNVRLEDVWETLSKSMAPLFVVEFFSSRANFDGFQMKRRPRATRVV